MTETQESARLALLDRPEDIPLHLLGNHPAEQYCRFVLTGHIPACKLVKLACLRHVLDLRDGHLRGLWFDPEAAQHRIDFYRFCRHFEGEWAGQVIQPEPWQQFIKWCIYGWRRADGSRRFRRVYEEVARKNGKSTDLGSDGNYLAFFDGEAGAQVFTAATKKDQAAIIHRSSTRMVKASPALRRRIKVYKNNLHSEETASRYEPLGEDSKTEDGRNVHAALIDEYHAHPSADMYNVLRSGMGARRQPLLYVITTAGFDHTSACYTEREYAVDVLQGTFEDDSYFAIIFTVDDESAWTEETEWYKANPNLGVSVKLDDMREQCLEAQRVPSKQNEFKTKRLNIWTESRQIWITAEAWEQCNKPVDVEGLRGRKCYGGLDLSSTTDMSAWVLVFPPETPEDDYRCLYRFFVPQSDLERQYPKKEILDRVRLWIRQGFVTATPGNRIDYDFIRAQILDDAAAFDLQEIAFDPYNASQITNDLAKEGLELVEFRQGFLSMSPAAKEYERLVSSGRLAHGGNPVMKWMVSCAETDTDAAGNIKPVKPDRTKSSKRIDGVIANIMPVYRASIQPGNSNEVGIEIW